MVGISVVVGVGVAVSAQKRFENNLCGVNTTEKSNISLHIENGKGRGEEK